jgi:hypothetical protein
MPNSSTSLSYPKKPVLQNIIVLPFAPDSYQSLVLSAQSFCSFLQQQFLDSPELFPPSFAQGFQMKDIYFSKKLELYFRCILIDSITYQVRPSFVTPYFTALTDDVSHALFLRKFPVPYWALTHVFGRNDMFWYRLDSSLGRHSLVSTTVKSPRGFLQRIRNVEKWLRTEGAKYPQELVKALEKLIANKEEYALGYKEGAYRTSNEGDRLMQRLERHLYLTKYFKGTVESARLSLRAWAFLQNFAPQNPQTVKIHKGSRSPAEQLNRKTYHSNWLHHLFISSSHSSPTPSQIPLQ